MMEHEEVRTRLSAYIDHELSAAESLELESHLKGCASCSAELEAIRDLVSRAAELPGSLEPGRDLWPGLRARIAPEAVRGRAGWKRFLFPEWNGTAALAAAAAAAIVIAGAVWFWSTGRTPGAPVPEPVAVNEAGRPSDITVINNRGEARPGDVAQMIWALEEESLGAGKTLMAKLESGTDGLSPEGLEAIDTSLRVLDQAIQESVTRLNQDPNNPRLLERVTGYYRQRLSLLKMATRLANQA